MVLLSFEETMHIDEIISYSESELMWKSLRSVRKVVRIVHKHSINLRTHKTLWIFTWTHFVSVGGYHVKHQPLPVGFRPLRYNAQQILIRIWCNWKCSRQPCQLWVILPPPKKKPQGGHGIDWLNKARVRLLVKPNYKNIPREYPQNSTLLFRP